MQQADNLFVRLAPHSEVLEPALSWAGAGKLPGRHEARELCERPSASSCSVEPRQSPSPGRPAPPASVARGCVSCCGDDLGAVGAHVRP